MKLSAFIKNLDALEDALEIEKNCNNPGSIDCVVLPRAKFNTYYPITSITITSTPKNTRVILNAEYETVEGRTPIKLDQLYADLKELYKHLEDHERKGSIFASIKKSKNAPITFHIIPNWGYLGIDIELKSLVIKATNSFTYKN